MPPYMGEIRMFAGNFAPAGWAFCDGQILPISEYDALFTLLQTRFGGDGQETFGLPDLRGRVPIHNGNSPFGTTFTLAENGGTPEETLTVQQIPQHTHAWLASQNGGTQNNPGGNVLADGTATTLYRAANANLPYNPQVISPNGGSQPHTNVMPFLAINFILSLYGVFPNPT